MTTSSTQTQQAGLLASDVTPYRPAATTWGRYYSSTYTIYDVFDPRPNYTFAGWEAHKLHVEYIGMNITCNNVQIWENVLVILFHPRMKFCLPFIYVIHKFQLYFHMTWSSCMSAFLKHGCSEPFPLNTNFFYGVEGTMQPDLGE
jgi:hypothetical protein